MQEKPLTERPVLKVSDSPDLENDAYIYFDEEVGIPGFGNAQIRIEFDKVKSFDEVSALAKQLTDAGFVFVVQK